jgi:hypothetical protein
LAFHDWWDGAFGGLFACCLSGNIIAVAGPSTLESGELIRSHALENGIC